MAKKITWTQTAIQADLEFINFGLKRIRAIYLAKNLKGFLMKQRPFYLNSQKLVPRQTFKT